jgi:hypothetical protein
MNYDVQVWIRQGGFCMTSECESRVINRQAYMVAPERKRDNILHLGGNDRGLICKRAIGTDGDVESGLSKR